MRVLLVHPDLAAPGGVAAYYRALEGRFRVEVEHHAVGSRPDERGALSRLRRLRRDGRELVDRAAQGSFDVVHLNPSLDLRSVLRDGRYHRALRRRGARTVVFFHGWDPRFERLVDRGLRGWFHRLFGDAGACVVLADAFGETLRRWGFRQPIHREVTVADDTLLAGFDAEGAVRRRLAERPRRLLFLSRIAPGKGHMAAIQALAVLAARRDDVELVVAGDGAERAAAMRLAERIAPGIVQFPGHVSGAAKRELYERAALLLFPTAHGEGLPIALVESMFFALPVVTQRVGGIADFFVDGDHGFAPAGLDPLGLAAAVERLLDDEALYRRVAATNRAYALGHFLAAGAAARLEEIYSAVHSGTSPPSPGVRRGGAGPAGRLADETRRTDDRLTERSTIRRGAG